MQKEIEHNPQHNPHLVIIGGQTLPGERRRETHRWNQRQSHSLGFRSGLGGSARTVEER
jgi:hypothetical protein